MASMSRLLVLVMCAGFMLSIGAPVHGDVITGTHGLNGIGKFSGTVTYSALTDHSALLEIDLTNTSTSGRGGYLTGFAFNNPSGDITGATLTGSNSWFLLLGGPTFNSHSVSASPYGQFDMGAALGGDFLGGGNPNHGIAVGHSAQFFFALTGQHLKQLSDSSFLTDPSIGPGNGAGDPPFVARFRGFSEPGPTSDKVPLDYHGNIDPPPVDRFPEPATALLGGLGMLASAGFALLRRAQLRRAMA